MTIEKISRMKITSLLAISMLYLCSTSMASLTRTRPLVSNLNKSIGGTVPGMLGSSAASYSTSFEYNPNPNLSTPTGSSQADLTTQALPTYSTNLMPNTSPTYNSQRYKSQNSFNVDVNAAMKKADEELTSDEILNNIDSIIESTPSTIFSTGTSTSSSIYGKSRFNQQARNFSTQRQIIPDFHTTNPKTDLFNFLNLSENATRDELTNAYDKFLENNPNISAIDKNKIRSAYVDTLDDITPSSYFDNQKKLVQEKIETEKLLQGTKASINHLITVSSDFVKAELPQYFNNLNNQINNIPDHLKIFYTKTFIKDLKELLQQATEIKQLLKEREITVPTTKKECIKRQQVIDDIMTRIAEITTKEIRNDIYDIDKIKDDLKKNKLIQEEITYLFNYGLEKHVNDEILTTIANKTNEKIPLTHLTCIDEDFKKIISLIKKDIIDINDLISGETILYHRADKAHIHDVEFLLKYNADPNIICNQETVLDKMYELKKTHPGNTEITKTIELLEKNGAKTTYEIENPNSGELLRTIKKWF